MDGNPCGFLPKQRALRNRQLIYLVNLLLTTSVQTSSRSSKEKVSKVILVDALGELATMVKEVVISPLTLRKTCAQAATLQHETMANEVALETLINQARKRRINF